jgi:DNA topoisomerase-1
LSGIVHVSDDEPGIRRRGRKRFSYVRDTDGSAVRDARTLARIDSIVIPPAWTDVWICADPRGHIQATGRDDRGRKQYRYHPDHRARRERRKFADLVPFGECLPALRRQVDRDLSSRGISQERVVALVIALIDRTGVRIGNAAYARENGTFGLTTLRDRHADVTGSTIRFCFKAKGGKSYVTEVVDPRLARLLKRCQDIPGQVLFQWEDERGRHPVHSHDVNDRIRELTGSDATAKTFRTWVASVEAARILANEEVPASAAATNRTVVAAVDEVADRLGNTRAVARASYVHPSVITSFETGRLEAWWHGGPSRDTRWMEADERRLLHVLKKARRAG